jgi:hypothetical protein
MADGRRSSTFETFVNAKVAAYKTAEENLRGTQGVYDAQYVVRELGTLAASTIAAITAKGQEKVAQIEEDIKAAKAAAAKARTAADERVDWARVQGLQAEFSTRLTQAGASIDLTRGARRDLLEASAIRADAKVAGDIHRLRALRTAGAGLANVEGGAALHVEFEQDEIEELGPDYQAALAAEQAAVADRYEIDQVISRGVGASMGLSYETVRGVKERVSNPTFGEGWA